MGFRGACHSHHAAKAGTWVGAARIVGQGCRPPWRAGGGRLRHDRRAAPRVVIAWLDATLGSNLADERSQRLAA
jgi:hypothetical protein